MKKGRLICIAFASFFIAACQAAYSHCDTMDGPVVADMKKAFEKNNVNYVLKWVRANDEDEIKKNFSLAARVRILNADARDLSEKYFSENLVRIHRAGEGVAYTGVKPSGTPVNELIKAADRSIDSGNLSPLEKIFPQRNMPKLKELFDRAMRLKNFEVNDVKAGREYIEAYVQFFHFAEGEETHGHGNGAGHALIIAVVASTVFFVAAVLFALLYFRTRKAQV